MERPSLDLVHSDRTVQLVSSWRQESRRTALFMHHGLGSQRHSADSVDFKRLKEILVELGKSKQQVHEGLAMRKDKADNDLRSLQERHATEMEIAQ